MDESCCRVALGGTGGMNDGVEVPGWPCEEEGAKEYDGENVGAAGLKVRLAGI